MSIKSTLGRGCGTGQGEGYQRHSTEYPSLTQQKRLVNAWLDIATGGSWSRKLGWLDIGPSRCLQSLETRIDWCPRDQ